MEICKFDKFKDFPEVREWHRMRGQEIKATRLPSTGWIVHGVAACFCYHDKTSTLGFIHGLISNPKADTKEVYEAVIKMFEQGERDCRDNQIEVVVFTTKLNSIEKIAEKIGYQKDEDKASVLVRQFQ